MSFKAIIIKRALYYYPQLLIVGLILLLYIQNLWFDFAYLDDNLIVFSEYSKISSISKILNAFKSGYLYNSYYRPIVMISFIFDTAIAGQSSMMYHLTNIMIHIIVSLLVYKLLLKFNAKQNISLLLSIFFAINPINVNAVSWIVGRNDLLLAMFSILSILFFIKHNESNKIIFLLLSSFFYLLALLSKEAAIALLFIFVIYTRLFIVTDNFFSKKYFPISIYIIPTVIYFLLKTFVAKIHTQDKISLEFFIQNLYVIFEYIAKLIYYPAIEPLPNKNYFLILFGVILVLVFLFVFFRIINEINNKRTFIFGSLFFLTFVLPSLFIRMNSDDGGFNYIDCRVYLPSFGFLILLSVIIQSFKFRINSMISSLLVIIFFIYSIMFNNLKNQAYRNGPALWNTAIENHPQRAKYWIGLAFYYYDNKDFLKAAKYAQVAINLKPDNPEYYHKAALAFELSGEISSSITLLNKVLALEKDKSSTIIELIKIHLKINDFDKCKELSNEFLKINFENKKKKIEMYSSIAYYFNQYKSYQNAIKFMKIALLEKPDCPNLNNDLGIMYYNNNNIDSARIYIEKAITLEPGNADYINNLNYIRQKINEENYQ